MGAVAKRVNPPAPSKEPEPALIRGSLKGPRPGFGVGCFGEEEERKKVRKSEDPGASPFYSKKDVGYPEG